MLKRQLAFAFKIKNNKIRIKDLKAVRKFVTAITDAEKDARIKEIDSDFNFYKPEQRDYLRSVYTKYYTKGLDVVDDDIFTNTSRATFTEIVDRFEKYPKVEDLDLTFIENLSKGQQQSMDKILQASDTSGYDVKFAYYIYEKFYIDETRELEEQNADTPEGLKDETVYFLSDMAYADGVESAVEELASKAIESMAKEKLEKEERA